MSGLSTGSSCGCSTRTALTGPGPRGGKNSQCQGLIVVYDGGAITEAEIKQIVLADGELAGFAFVARHEVAGLVTPLLARRVASCLDAVAAGRVAALENGSPAA